MGPWNPPWRREGQEPDYRFTLANERTFLAWIRTALALLAAGVLLAQFATRLSPRLLLIGAAATLALLAALISVLAYPRWRANEIAMRHLRTLPGSVVVPVLAAGMTLVCAALAVLVLLR